MIVKHKILVKEETDCLVMEESGYSQMFKAKEMS